MCLAVPMRVVTVTGDLGRAEANGVQLDVRLDLVAPVAVGDYVLIHAGFAIQRLDAAEAEETIAYIEAARPAEPEDAPRGA